MQSRYHLVHELDSACVRGVGRIQNRHSHRVLRQEFDDVLHDGLVDCLSNLLRFGVVVVKPLGIFDCAAVFNAVFGHVEHFHGHRMKKR